MQIGMMKPAKKFAFEGRMMNMAIAAEIALSATNSANPKAPKFDVMIRSPYHGKYVPVGGAWERTSTADKRIFYTATIHDDDLPKGKMDISFFPQNDGSMAIGWKPASVLASQRANRKSEQHNAGNTDTKTANLENDGFGSSTAPDMLEAA